jgi:hypothetical protein
MEMSTFRSSRATPAVIRADFRLKADKAIRNSLQNMPSGGTPAMAKAFMPRRTANTG